MKWPALILRAFRWCLKQHDLVDGVAQVHERGLRAPQMGYANPLMRKPGDAK